MNLNDRMKYYEKTFIHQQAIKGLPIIARIDGRNFSSFTKNMIKPFDYTFLKCMEETTKHLVKETGANIGYTQSDEITLIWKNNKDGLWFEGKLQKMVSQLAAQATVAFNHNLGLWFANDKELKEKFPTFDARVWQVPSDFEASNVLVWREQDAIKNSISMACHSVFSHKEMLNKNSAEKLQMLLDKGIDWNKYKHHARQGIFIKRKVIERPYYAHEIDELPEKHQAKEDPLLLVKRNVYVSLEENFVGLTMLQKLVFTFNMDGSCLIS